MSSKKCERERKIPIQFYVNEKEMKVIKRSMERANIKSKSDYMRQLCVYGKVINFEDMYFRKCFTALDCMSKNLNQIAKAANTTGSIYREDIQLLSKNISVINDLMSETFLKIEKLLEKVENIKVLTMTEEINKAVDKLHKEKFL